MAISKSVSSKKAAPPAARTQAEASNKREMFVLRRRANLFLNMLPGSAEERRRERESVWCFLTSSDIPTVAEGRVGVAGVMAGDFGRKTIVENDGGTVGVGDNPGRGDGGAFMVEFNIARIDDTAFFGVAFDVGAEARGAWGRSGAGAGPSARGGGSKRL